METTSSTDDSKASPEGLAETASQAADTVPEAASKSASRPFTIARPSFRTVESTTKYPPLTTRMSAHDESPRHSVKITFTHEGTQPPVYVAGSFTSPPWEPQEMAVGEEKTDSNDLIFHKEFDTIEEGEYQYKFRLGSGDWWVLDENAASVTDDSGNRNNLLVVKPELTPATLPTPPSEEASQEPIPAVTNHTVKDLETQPGDQTTGEPQFGENPVASDQEQPVYGDTEPESLEEDSEKRTADAEPDAEYTSPNVAAQPEQPTETLEIPTLIIEKTDDEPAHGDDFGRDATPGQKEAHEKRAADAEPDHVIVSPETNEPPYEETEAPLLSHESIEIEEEDAPLFAHEVSYENADEPSPPGEQPVTAEAGIPLFAHEVSHEETGRLSTTGQQKGPSSVGSAASYDSDVHDPSVEAFPTTKEEIYRQLERAESRLREDEVVTEGIPPSTLRHSPSLSKTASVADAASPLEAIGEDEESEEDVKPVDLQAPVMAPPETEHIEDIVSHVVEPTQPAPEEIPSETIAKDELTLENVEHVPVSSAPALTGSNASEGEARNLSGSTDGVAESKVAGPSTVPESESTVPESQASSDQVATTTADKDTAPEPVPAPESNPDPASVTIPDSTSAPSASAEEVLLTPPLTPKDVLTAPAPASSADAVVREAEESKEVADQAGQPGEPEPVDDGPAVEPPAEGKVESEDQHGDATSKHIEEGQTAHGEETGKGKEPERQGAREGEEIRGPVEGTEGEGEGAPELESEGLRQRKIAPQESQQKSNGDTATAKSRDRSADRESAAATAGEEEPADERAGTVGLHHGKHGWIANLWQSLFGSWLSPIGRFLAKCFGAGGGRNA